MNYTAVITTINEPTKAVKEFAKRLPLIVIGDEKTPITNWDGVHYFGIRSYPYNYKPPLNHYARKNLGYLAAMEAGYDCIYDTDDDNIPNENWKLRDRKCRAMQPEGKGWCNVYRYLVPDLWPRGLPLTHINSVFKLSDPLEIPSPIHQGLADNDPDIDAICRLIHSPNTCFKYDRTIHLPPGTWSPFNSQTTWWFKEAFPLMYLPQYCTMRATDIVRSYIAQRCLWELGCGVVFHSPSEVIQERNPHDLMSDLRDEIAIYLNADNIKMALDELFIGSDSMAECIEECYRVLILKGMWDKREMISLKQWLNDIKGIQ